MELLSMRSIPGGFIKETRQKASRNYDCCLDLFDNISLCGKKIKKGDLYTKQTILLYGNTTISIFCNREKCIFFEA